ncbi:MULTISPECIES: arginase family protein [Ramlibacter]|uniref:Agmatinase n=1 Tax=Ramlibacter pinisoli TaxID=2682844 RepID=A0A6N8ITL8_9BURK|nr:MULTISPECIES: arginase family protein [Ramlibacter]MBA2965222.1 arginase family protein [Ramlibacter sp. CGMCC 1.13660]MVQ30187.1 agmatinase [Ramlibacter pinisoli]
MADHPYSPGEGLLGPQTFMGLPFAPDAQGARAFVCGVPFDCGTHPTRVGARQGPAHVRRHSTTVRPFHPERGDTDWRQALGAVDVGDIAVVPSQIEVSFAAIERVMTRLQEAPGAVPFTIGGDGSVSLPLMRAAAARHPGLVALHFDAHTDCMAPPAPGLHNTGTQFWYAATEGRIDPARSWHIGMRGTLAVAGSFTTPQELGFRMLPLAQLLERGLRAAMAEVRASVGDAPVYLCWDMDVIDPAFAPGVAAPSWGGLSAREALELLQLLQGLNIVHVDINTVSPPHDPTGAAGSLAAQLLYEAMGLLHARRS